MKRFCEISFIFLLLFIITSCYAASVSSDPVLYDFSGYVYGDKDNNGKREALEGIKLQFEGSLEIAETKESGYFCFDETQGACGVLKISDPSNTFKNKSLDIDLLRVNSIKIILERK